MKIGDIQRGITVLYLYREYIQSLVKVLGYNNLVVPNYPDRDEFTEIQVIRHMSDIGFIFNETKHQWEMIK